MYVPKYVIETEKQMRLLPKCIKKLIVKVFLNNERYLLKWKRNSSHLWGIFTGNLVGDTSGRELFLWWGARQTVPYWRMPPSPLPPPVGKSRVVPNFFQLVG